MSNDAEKDLDAFLAALPSYKRIGIVFSLFTQDEYAQWAQWMATSPEEWDVLWREHLRLITRIPTKLKEYRKRMDREYGRGSAALFLGSLGKGNPGRKRNDSLAARIWALDAEGKSNREIQEALNGAGKSLSIEGVESYLKSRRRSNKLT